MQAPGGSMRRTGKGPDTSCHGALRLAGEAVAGKEKATGLGPEASRGLWGSAGKEEWRSQGTSGAAGKEGKLPECEWLGWWGRTGGDTDRCSKDQAGSNLSELAVSFPQQTF